MAFDRTADPPDPAHVLALRGVGVVRSGKPILADIDWTIRNGERWAIVGPNGSGKTTLLSIAGTYLWPSRGSVSLLGQAVGTLDVRELRRRIGLVSSYVAQRIPPQLTAQQVVVAGATGSFAPWWDRADPSTDGRAAQLLEFVGCDNLADRQFRLLSSGEQQRVQVARALMLDPALLLLDEPAAGLDLAARETLALLLERLNGETTIEAIVLVTHHIEEIPPGTTHALALRSGRTVAAGSVREVVTSAVLSETFGLALEVHHLGDRFAARAMRAVPR